MKVYKQIPDKIEPELAKFGIEYDATNMSQKLLSDLPFSSWREIPMILIRPENEIVLDLMDFEHNDIKEVIKQGRNIAKKTLASGVGSGS